MCVCWLPFEAGNPTKCPDDLNYDEDMWPGISIPPSLFLASSTLQPALRRAAQITLIPPPTSGRLEIWVYCYDPKSPSAYQWQGMVDFVIVASVECLHHASNSDCLLYWPISNGNDAHETANSMDHVFWLLKQH